MKKKASFPVARLATTRRSAFGAMLALLATLVLMLAATPAKAQRISLKTNGLGWLTLSPNVGAEFRLSRHNTLNLEASVGYLTLGKRHQRHALFIPEVRHWFSARPQARWFCGAMLLGGAYKVKLSDTPHNGLALGIGVTGGYSFVLDQRWSLELSAGAGFLHRSEKHKNYNQLAPLKLGVSIVYILK
ncbi:MAG: DUF3575 domain-containing protein [Bacteroidaceae bacterium]|nr:DUF3575 domain-containing protein [Bacteroidaceae bacterium]